MEKGVMTVRKGLKRRVLIHEVEGKKNA